MTQKIFGPWFVGAQNDYPYVIDRAPKSCNDYYDHDADVALVAKPFEVRGMPVADVARLIAAAPDLLEALQDMLNAESSYPYGGMSDSEIAAIAKAHAAVAKATVDQP